MRSPDSTSGITARYHMAGALATLGRNEEAIKEYDEVVRRSGASSLYGRMARLGKADAQAHSGQLDAAIVTWKEMTTGDTEDLPVDAILIELARAYVQKGNTEEAGRRSPRSSISIPTHRISPRHAPNSRISKGKVSALAPSHVFERLKIADSVEVQAVQ